MFQVNKVKEHLSPDQIKIKKAIRIIVGIALRIQKDQSKFDDTGSDYKNVSSDLD